MGIPPTKKTKTGFSTDEEVLTELSQKYKIAEYMLTYRKYAKLKNTYLDVFPTLINEKTGLVSKNELDSASDEIMRVFNSLYQYYAKTLAK